MISLVPFFNSRIPTVSLMWLHASARWLQIKGKSVSLAILLRTPRAIVRGDGAY
jgi:hypothetical protein